MNIGIIPARLNSSRFPEKLLFEISGVPILVHTYNQVCKSNNLDKIIVATDSKRILRKLLLFDIEAVMTSIDHKSGTDRVYEVAEKFNDDDIIINIQGDEPLLSPNIIDNLIDSFMDNSVEMSTAVTTKLSMDDLTNENVVKVYLDKNGYAINFNRNPFYGKTIDRLGGMYKHLGIYAFRNKTLKLFSSCEISKNEKVKRLEQMRALDNGIKIKAIIVYDDIISVNSKEDIKLIESNI